MKTSSNANGSGSNVSGDVWLPKGTTLKGTMLIYRHFTDAPRIMNFPNIYEMGSDMIGERAVISALTKL